MNNHKFTVCETFVGCGGSHFGFKKADFQTLFVNDIWSDAIKSLVMNDTDLQENQILETDIKQITLELLQEKKIDAYNMDVLIGGVVCKGFSLAGIRNPHDERNYLYLEQLRLVQMLQPKVSIIENVPGMLSMNILRKNENVELCAQLDTICTNHKNVRGKIIAFKKQVKDCTLLQEQLNQLTNDRKNIEKQLEHSMYSVIEHIEQLYTDYGYTTYKKILKCNEYGCATTRKRLFIVAVRNDIKKPWVFPTPLETTITVGFIFNQMNEIHHPSIDPDNVPMCHKESTIEKFKKIGEKNETYFSRGTSSRLALDKPAPTLVPGHSSFQIHPTEHRSITVREGAMITGFDPQFRFYGSHSSRCVQIGNAIPINMAYEMAKQCKLFLESI